MQSDLRSDHRASLLRIPDTVVSVVASLRAGRHRAYLVGGCLRDSLCGRPVGDYDVTTSALPEAVLAAFPRAIPIGLRHGTVMVPTPSGPIDVTSFRGGPDLEDDLSHRDFTVNAMAYDPCSGEFVDLFGGREDLARRRLRAVGKASARFREDPLRILRAARLAATLEFDLDEDVTTAMTALCKEIGAVARERVRRELALLLLATGSARGLKLLRHTGVEADLAPGTASDAAAVVPSLPGELDLRLAGWLRGTSAEGILRRLRFPHRTTRHVAHLLRHHPIEASVHPKRDVEVRRLIRRVGDDDLEWLFALREAEIDAAGATAAGETAREAVHALRTAIERVRRSGALALRRFDLAIDGGDVMTALGCGPGRDVGLALRYLTEQVIEDPERNTPERLLVLLRTWWAERHL